MIKSIYKCSICILFLLGITASITYAQTITTPVNVHLPIIYKSLLYDRTLMAKNDETITIGIVYQNSYRTSLSIKNQVEQITESYSLTKIRNKHIKLVLININSSEDLQKFLDKVNIDVLYFTPLRSLDIEELAEISMKRNLLTVTGVSEYIYKNISLSIDVVGDNPKIIVNLSASRQSGTDFDSKLLTLAKVIRNYGK